MKEIRESTKQKYINKKYNYMTILDVVRRDPKHTHHYFVLAKCDCGTVKEVRLSVLQQNTTISCGCVGKQKRLTKNLNNTYNRKSFGENAQNIVFNSYKRGAKTRNLNFELSKEDFLNITQQSCFYCGVAPTKKKTIKNAYGYFVYNGIDRMDNSVGYIKENCVAACKPCNVAKNAITKDMIFKLYHRLFPHT
jgi:hypothetical protein